MPKTPKKRKRVIAVTFELHDYHSPEFPDGGFLNLDGVKSDLLEAMDYMDVEVKKLKIRRVKV